MIVLWIFLGIIALLALGGAAILIHDEIWYRKKEKEESKNRELTME